MVKKYEDEEEDIAEFVEGVDDVDQGEQEKKGGTHVAIHSSGFRDFLLKPQLLRAIEDCTFEHPSEVQHRCIPQAILGTDVICQAQSGMGKTAVFVLSVLQQLEPSDETSCVVVCHTRELAYQICHEFIRFSKYLGDISTKVFFGGIPVANHRQQLQFETPNIVVATPGRLLDLVESGHLKLNKCRHFILDECDKLLDNVSMRSCVQKVFFKTPKDKQVMMFSATMSEEVRSIAKKFMHNPLEILVDDQSKLTLHGLKQYYVKLAENEKNRKLNQILNSVDFNQVVIFVRQGSRAKLLTDLINDYLQYPTIYLSGRMQQAERIQKYQDFKEDKYRILVATDLVGRGIDIQKVNVVINYDMPTDSDQYLHRCGRAGRFGTRGVTISFVTKDEDKSKLGKGREFTDEEIFEQIEKRFSLVIEPLPDKLDSSSYMNA